MRSADAMNAEDVARYLDLGKNTVYQLAKSGQLASYRVGRKLRFSLEDVEAYLASTRQAPAGSPSIQGTGTQALAMDQLEPNDSLSSAAAFGVLSGEAFTIAGEDLIADLIAGSLCSRGIPATRMARGSYTALVNLYAGDADMAVVNLYEQRGNSFNLPFVRNLAPGASVIVFRLCARPVGFIVGRGNPKRLTTWGALLREDVRISNRTRGCSARILLDEKLQALEARSNAIDGYDLCAQVASMAVNRVASGMADVAIGAERDAAAYSELAFVPLMNEWVDLVVVKSERTRPLVRALKDLLTDPLFKQELESSGTNDVSKLGAIIYET